MSGYILVVTEIKLFLKKIKQLTTTTPKKTWGGQCFPQGLFFVANFVMGGRKSAPKIPPFLSCKTLALIIPRPIE